MEIVVEVIRLDAGCYRVCISNCNAKHEACVKERYDIIKSVVNFFNKISEHKVQFHIDNTIMYRGYTVVKDYEELYPLITLGKSKEIARSIKNVVEKLYSLCKEVDNKIFEDRFTVCFELE